MFCTFLDFMVQQRPPRTCTDWKSASVLSPVPNGIKADFSLFINTNYLSPQRQCEAQTGRTLCLFCFLKLIMNRPVHSEHKLVWGLQGWFPAGPKKAVFFPPDANYDVISGRVMFKMWRCDCTYTPSSLGLKVACKVLYAHYYVCFLAMFCYNQHHIIND